MKLAGVTSFIVNGGGDMYVQADESIEFALEDPYDPTKNQPDLYPARCARR